MINYDEILLHYYYFQSQAIKEMEEEYKRVLEQLENQSN